MNGKLRYLVLALLLSTNAVIAEDKPEIETPKPKVVAAEPKVVAAEPKVVAAEPKAKGDADEEERTLGDVAVDGLALIDGAYVSVKEMAAKVVAYGKKEFTPSKEREATQLGQDWSNSANGLWTQVCLNVAKLEVKFQEGVVASLKEEVKTAQTQAKSANEALARAKAEVITDANKEAHEARVEKLSEQVTRANKGLEDVRTGLSAAEKLLGLRKSEKTTAEAERAKFELFKIKVVAERASEKASDAKKDFDEAKKAHTEAKKDLKSFTDALKNLKSVKGSDEARSALKANIENAQERVDKAKEAQDTAEEVYKIAVKAKDKAAKKVSTKEKETSSEGTFAGVTTFVNTYPRIVAVGGATAVVVAVVALYKWNSAAHQVTTLEEELAELETTNANA